MSIATDVRAYADLALEQGKTVLGQASAVINTANKRLAAEAPKPVFAALGVADLVAEAVTKRAETVGKRVEALPADAAGNVAKAQGTGKALLSKTQDDARARIAELRGSFDKLAVRGEAKFADLRKDPRVSKLLGELDDASTAVGARLDSVRSEVRPYLSSAFDAVEDVLGEPGKTPTRKTTARRTTARRTSGTSTSGTSASGASASGTSASRTSTKRAATKAPAKTASTTRARKAPAKKA